MVLPWKSVRFNCWSAWRFKIISEITALFTFRLRVNQRQYSSSVLFRVRTCRRAACDCRISRGNALILQSPCRLRLRGRLISRGSPAVCYLWVSRGCVRPRADALILLLRAAMSNTVDAAINYQHGGWSNCLRRFRVSVFIPSV